MNTVNVYLSWSLLGLAVVAPLLFFHHGMDFDVLFSPAWQVGIYHALFAAMGLMWYLTAVHLLLPNFSGRRRMALGVGVVMLACSFALSSWQLGGHWGIRNEWAMNAVVVFVVLSPLALILSRVCFRCRSR